MWLKLSTTSTAGVMSSSSRRGRGTQTTSPSSCWGTRWIWTRASYLKSAPSPGARRRATCPSLRRVQRTISMWSKPSRSLPRMHSSRSTRRTSTCLTRLTSMTRRRKLQLRTAIADALLAVCRVEDAQHSSGLHVPRPNAIRQEARVGSSAAAPAGMHSGSSSTRRCVPSEHHTSRGVTAARGGACHRCYGVLLALGYGGLVVSRPHRSPLPDRLAIESRSLALARGRGAWACSLSADSQLII
mmetsp:Transcript_21/g.74  ORF Transcript_21/g.74 Transcript_21/m.74 type:complete len:243 (-) Transcript_21:164-892(-)